MKRIFTLTLLLIFHTGSMLFAQIYSPIAITGYNNDIVAEAGTDAVATTSTVIDGSNHVIYTQGFGATNGLAGGILNTGTYVSGTRTYQMASYTASNALYMSAAGNVANSLGVGTLTLNTPGSYSRLSLLAFGTEGTSTVTVTFNFMDGTTSSGGNITLKDWFNGTPYIFNGFGRLTRTAAPNLTVDGLPTNPRMYSFDFAVPCADQARQLKSVTFTYIPGANISSRAVILAISGVTSTPLSHTATITDALCGGANGSIALQVTGGTAPITYTWNTAPVQTTATATNLPAGNYICSIKDASNCITSYRGTVSKNSAVTLTASASPADICSGESATLTTTATGGTVSNYSWTPAATASNTITVSPSDTTLYTVSGDDAFGCKVSATVTVNVKKVPGSAFTVAPATVCLGTPQTLTITDAADPAATYNWNNFAGATVQSGSGAGPYNILFNSAGTYDIQLQVTGNGCSSALSTQQLTVSPPPVVNMQVSKTPVCAGEPVTVTFTGSATANATPLWNWNGGTVQNGSGFGPYTVVFGNTTNIELSVTDGACVVAAAPVAVTAIPLPAADFTPDILSGCAPAEITFTNQSQHADTYQWSFGNGQQTSATSPVYTYGTPGVYTVTLKATAQGQCSHTLTKTALITILPPPVAAFNANPGENTETAFKNALFTFTNNSQYATSYEWDFGDGATSILMSPEHKYELPGQYRVVLYATNEIGCTDTISHAWYKVIPDLLLQIPNVFSPNGDGTNDYWSIDGLKARPEATTEVFNRWGQPVFKSTGYTTGWDGTHKGKPMPTGTYYYIIKTSATEKPYTGWVQLLR